MLRGHVPGNRKCGNGGTFVQKHVDEYLKVSTLYISQIKRKNGIEMRDNYNKSQKADAKVA